MVSCTECFVTISTLSTFMIVTEGNPRSKHTESWFSLCYYFYRTPMLPATFDGAVNMCKPHSYIFEEKYDHILFTKAGLSWIFQNRKKFINFAQILFIFWQKLPELIRTPKKNVAFVSYPYKLLKDISYPYIFHSPHTPSIENEQFLSFSAFLVFELPAHWWVPVE